MKAVLRSENKPVHVEIVDMRYNRFYDQVYVTCKVLKSAKGYKCGEIVHENQRALYLRAAHLKEKFCFAGRPDLSNVPYGPNFKFSEL